MVLDVPEALAGAYHGSGHALAAHRDGVLLDLIYLRDVLPDFDGETVVVGDFRLGPTIHHLAQRGDVSIGMVSSWQFCEL